MGCCLDFRKWPLNIFSKEFTKPNLDLELHVIDGFHVKDIRDMPVNNDKRDLFKLITKLSKNKYKNEASSSVFWVDSIAYRC